MREFYPPIDPYQSGLADVGDGQRIYYEQSGNPAGKPVVVVHGGPGGGTSPQMRQFFDPDRYRIVLFDQRGCGKSLPHIADGADLSVNTTDALIGDLEFIREELAIERWQVFGGSWGSTLSLAYAQRYPERVTELVLRGIFLLRRTELDWYYNEGASHIYPDRWEQFVAPIAHRDRRPMDGGPPTTTPPDYIDRYRQLLASDDRQVAVRAARAWTEWETSTSRLMPREAEPDDDRFAIAFASIENHYFSHGGFLDDGQLLADAHRIADIPGVIVQGRYDVVCPARSAWDLHRAWPGADLRIVPDAGHAAAEPGIVHELITATDRFAAQSS